MKLLQYPNKHLNVIANTVHEITDEIKQLCTDLKETAKSYSAQGLAATQVGSSHRVFVFKSDETEEFIACINPEILEHSATSIPTIEGCLSFPGVHEKIMRPESVSVRYEDEEGVVNERTLKGIDAVAFQHELDHLDGVTFIRHMGNVQKRLALKKLDKTRRTNDRTMKMLRKQMRAIKGASV